jgi:hypothetical protein
LGPKFRTKISGSAIEVVRDALDKFIISKIDTTHSKEVFAQWRAYVLEACAKHIQPESVDGFEVSKRAKQYLRFLKNWLIIHPVDKASGNYAFTCKKLYASVLRAELGKVDGAYKICDRAQADIISSHKLFLNRICFWDEKCAQLPFLYESSKLHKNPIAYRFIANCSRCTTTKLSKTLSDILNFLLRELKEKDDENIMKTGIRRFFVINGFQEVTQFLSKWSFHTFETVETGDFSTMYTTIPIDDMKRVLGKVLTEVWNYAAEKLNVVGGESNLYVEHTKHDVKWNGNGRTRQSKTFHSPHLHKMSRKNVEELIFWQLDNTYMVNGGNVYQQSDGIPMGTNDGPGLANLYCYGYEAAYIDKLALVAQDTARKFHMSFRLIDDGFSIDNKLLWHEAISKSYEDGGMYPKALTYNDTSISDKEVHFLGMKIKIKVGGKIEVDVFDKRKEFRFPIQRFPDMNSFIPESIPYGVFTGFLHLCYKICNSPNLFLSNVENLKKVFSAKGCTQKRLNKRLLHFLKSKSPLRWNMKWWRLYQFSTQRKVVGAQDEPD